VRVMGRGVGKILSVVLILAVTLVAGVYFYDFLIRSIDSPSSLSIAYVNYADLIQDSDVAYFTISIQNVGNKPITNYEISIIADAPASENTTITMLDVNNLNVVNGIVVNGEVVHKKGAGIFWYGPVSKVPKGKYVVKYWLKLNAPVSGHVLDLVISYNLGNAEGVLNRTSIYAENFTIVGHWQVFVLTVVLNKRENNLKLISYVEDKPNVSLSHIEIDRVESSVQGHVIVFTPENMMYENYTNVRLPVKPGESFMIRAVFPHYVASFTVGLRYRVNVMLTFSDNSTIRTILLVYARGGPL
jgi:hypothetical protein